MLGDQAPRIQRENVVFESLIFNNTRAQLLYIKRSGYLVKSYRAKM